MDHLIAQVKVVKAPNQGQREQGQEMGVKASFAEDVESQGPKG